MNACGNTPPLSTLNIGKSSIKALPKCLNYKITGICYWLKYNSLGIPYVSTTLRVKHYLPDAVVTAYPELGQNPWEYANTIIDKPSYSVGNLFIRKQTNNDMAGGNQEIDSPTDNALYFYEIDIIGNPAINAVVSLIPLPMIKPISTPFKPYFQSMLNSVSWRLGIESLHPCAWNPLGKVVGSKLQPWGTLYPRDGNITSSNRAKAAAVIALRAAHITTRSAQPHAYQHLKTDCGQQCDIAKVIENDNKIKWRRLYPEPENSCRVFGDDSLLDDYGKQFDEQDNKQYAWLLWREYSGCIQTNGQLLWVTPF